MIKKLPPYFVICFMYILLMSCKTKKQEKMETKNEITSPIKSDVYKTEEGTVNITLVGHGSLMFEFENKIIHVDPYSAVANYGKLPKADLIILTHEHSDHLDPKAIAAIKKDSTKFMVTEVCNQILGYGDIIKNGDTTSFEKIQIEAVPAYNIVNKRPDGEFYHPKGIGNGYIFTFDNLRVYVAGDTENIPEMDRLKGTIDVAFLPKNIPYTMTDEMFVDAAKKIVPVYLYPYHMNEFDENKIAYLIDNKQIKLIVKPMSNR